MLTQLNRSRTRRLSPQWMISIEFPSIGFFDCRLHLCISPSNSSMESISSIILSQFGATNRPTIPLSLEALAEIHREYLPTWSSSFYRPRDVELKNIGLVNVLTSDTLGMLSHLSVFSWMSEVETVFFATHSGVSTLHDGLLTPAVEVRDAEPRQKKSCSHDYKHFAGGFQVFPILVSFFQSQELEHLPSKELTAFHMCHHRSSFFYETLAKDGGILTIYEYSLLAKESVKVGR